MALSCRRRYLLRVLWAFGLAAVVVGSLLPASSAPMQLFNTVPDKLLHFAGYTLLALLPALHERPSRLTVLTVLLIALGVALEYAQRAEDAGRLFELRDIAANTIGVFGGLVLGLVFRS